VPALRTSQEGKETIMSDYDPMRRDPARPAANEAGYAADRGLNWSWILGGIAAIVVLIVALSFVGREDQTADNQRPVTTGQSSPTQSTPAPKASPTPPPAAERTVPPRPATPNQ
jgi:hypothetical protein